MTDPWATGAPRPTIPWHCDYCEKPTTLAVVERWWVTPDEDDEFDPFERVMAKCTSCAMPYVLGRDADYDGGDSPLEQVFPMTDQPLPRNVPKSIRDSHDEAIRCRKFRCYTAAALMARRGVEAMCAEQGQMNGTLAAKLTALKDAGVIDERLHEWSSVVRNIGNSGAHDVDASLSREDADDAIAFFEALVNYLYTFRQRYEGHLQRKQIEKDMKEIL
ncbi:DUF4145 domain-containing protein [Nocardioides caricicola]|uniref:DUF4145 domain-containing protein n=1 Tax=Nocardioides caricicola TaxID=634770 RepID=A0ABW0N254_9ACTN